MFWFLQRKPGADKGPKNTQSKRKKIKGLGGPFCAAGDGVDEPSCEAKVIPGGSYKKLALAVHTLKGAPSNTRTAGPNAETSRIGTWDVVSTCHSPAIKI